MVPVRPSAKSRVRAGFFRAVALHLRATRNEQQLFAHAHLPRNAVNPGDVFIVNVVVRDHHGGQHCIRVELDCRANEFFRRNRRTQIVHHDAVFLDAAVLDVDDLS